MTHTFKKAVKILLLVLLCVTLAGLVPLAALRMHDIRDFWRMRGYAPPSEIAAITEQTAMTAYGRRLFYVNHPALLGGTAFTDRCRLHAEKSIVLGCYKSGDNGIYVYNVTDQRLRGVVEVTSVHEMLHAGYERLSSKERSHINKLLEAYANNDLHDERIQAVLNVYRTAEPHEMDNEMHSIFATELAQLTPELEAYYSRYLTNRQKTVALAAAYQGEFTSRRDQVAAYDDELHKQKDTINSDQSNLMQMRSEIEQESQRMEALKAGGDIRSYNAAVDGYNRRANEYTVRAQALRQKIAVYNALVETRNQVAIEERTLMRAMGADTVPADPATP